MWNERYASKDYAYGIKPNDYFKESIHKLKLSGSILFPAEGEGRNAVYASKMGLNATAFDISVEGQKKAFELAKEEGVTINYEVGDLFNLDIVNQEYDVVALIYAHFPPPILSKYYQKIAELIKPNGIVVLEGFSKGHLAYRDTNPKVGGPNNLEMLFSVESIRNYFSDFEVIELQEVEIELNEGIYHNGTGKVIRFIGKKIAV